MLLMQRSRYLTTSWRCVRVLVHAVATSDEAHCQTDSLGSKDTIPERSREELCHCANKIQLFLGLGKEPDA